MRFFILCSLLFIGINVNAGEIGGVMVQESVKTDDGTVLQLNGAGIRSKFFMDIYIAQLYLEQPSVNAEEVIAADGSKRIVMHFLYKEVTQDKLVEGWNVGFTNNTEPDKLKNLQERIDTFNAMFDIVTKDQQIVFDYTPESGTRVIIAGQEKGVIAGKDFNDALLAIWLGEKPVTKKLKKALLEYKK